MTEAYGFEVKKTLKMKLRKIKKKDPSFFDAVIGKMAQIIEHPMHYKPLRSNLKGVRRVHVKGSFVLLFTVNEVERLVSFVDLDHHDVVYKRKQSY